MLGKKPLQGWKCATCDTNLVGMEGQPAQYTNWKKMPQAEKREIVTLLNLRLAPDTQSF